jgi:HK97 family phage major capsid protein
MAVNIIDRTGAQALIPDEATPEIIQCAIEHSTALSAFRRLPNMAGNVKSMPVLESLPMAYFVEGDTGLKQTTKVSWEKKYIRAEEIAAIVPIPENVLDDAADSGYDIWGDIKPLISQAIGQVIDSAVIFGYNKPASWRDDIVTSATAAGRVITAGSDLYADIMGENGAIAQVEKSGFMPSGVLASVAMRGALRNLRDSDGRPLFAASLRETGEYTLDGMPMAFVRNGAWEDDKALMIFGDMSQAVYSIRKDVTYRLLTEAIIQDPVTKEIVYNLAQQDMVALRVVMRLGWELPNPINALAPDKTERFPFAVFR